MFLYCGFAISCPEHLNAAILRVLVDRGHYVGQFGDPGIRLENFLGMLAVPGICFVRESEMQLKTERRLAWPMRSRPAPSRKAGPNRTGCELGGRYAR